MGKNIQLQNDLAYWGYDCSYARSSVIVLATVVIFQAKLVYTGHIYSWSTSALSLAYTDVEKWFNATQSFVVIPGLWKLL